MEIFGHTLQIDSMAMSYFYHASGAFVLMLLSGRVFTPPFLYIVRLHFAGVVFMKCTELASRVLKHSYWVDYVLRESWLWTFRDFWPATMLWIAVYIIARKPEVFDDGTNS